MRIDDLLTVHFFFFLFSDELPSEIILKGLKDDPTLSKESMVCKNPGCDGREARLLHQTKGEDQGLREFLICCECGKVYEKNTN